MPYWSNYNKNAPLSFERCESFGGGMNAFLRASLLPQDTCALIENGMVTDNLLVQKRKGTSVLGAAALAASPVQGMAYLDTPTFTNGLLVACCNQKLRVWNASSWTAANALAYTSSTAAGRVELVQGNNALYITDGVGHWYSYDGTELLDLGADKDAVASDPPVGCNMAAWHTSRMFAAGDATAPDSLWASGILTPGRGGWDHLNFRTRVGTGEGDSITALAGLHDYWLFVGTEGGMWLVNADPTASSAADWSRTKLTELLNVVGPRAVCRYGSDLLVMTYEGIHSIKRMEGSSQSYEVAEPLSEPLQPYIDRINWAYAHTICAAKFRQWALFAVPLDSATTPDHVLAWNRRWSGIWTGWTPRCFAVTRFGAVPELAQGDQSGRVSKWLYGSDSTATNVRDFGNLAGSEADIALKVRTRGLLFAEPVSEKDPEYFEARFTDSDGEASITLRADDTDVRAWSGPTQIITNQFPLSLPFDLATPRPITVRRSLTGVCRFNEAALDIECPTGNCTVKNVTMAAFVDTVQNE